jgi:hypothetical protein
VAGGRGGPACERPPPLKLGTIPSSLSQNLQKIFWLIVKTFFLAETRPGVLVGRRGWLVGYPLVRALYATNQNMGLATYGDLKISCHIALLSRDMLVIDG